jgi:uncharacterized protein with ParB-like and HNH nuclease domain
MKVNSSNLREFLRKSLYFRIPDFQRPYAWEMNQITVFLQDLVDTTKTKKKHYFGSLVFFREADHFAVIDGQQRLTTTVLFLVALYHELMAHPEKAHITFQQIEQHYLTDSYDGTKKLILRTATTDHDTFERIFNKKTLPSDIFSKLKKAYDKFVGFLSAENNLDIYIDALEQFEIITAELDTNDDKPQIIFKNINSTGKPLSEGDKIRNFALLLDTEKARNVVYNDYWIHIEKTLARNDGKKSIDFIEDFFRYYMMCQRNAFMALENVYRQFKLDFNEKVGEKQEINKLKNYYSNITDYLNSYLFVKFGDDKEEHYSFLKEINTRLIFLEFEIRIPFLLEVLNGYHKGNISQADTKSVFELLEKYFVRKMICGLATKGLNKKIPTWYNGVLKRKDDNNVSFYEAFENLILDITGEQSMPSDSDIDYAIDNLPAGSAVNRKYHQYIFAAICQYISLEQPILSQIVSGDKSLKLTLEHIMPQKLSEEWRKDLGEYAQIIHEKYLNRYANLTLVDSSYNSLYSNKTFGEKKRVKNGLEDSPLILNKYIAKFNMWGENEMKERAEWLKEQVKKIWKVDKLSDQYANMRFMLSNRQSHSKSFSFEELGIPIGSELVCTLDSSIRCTVQDGRNKVLYKGETTTLSAILKKENPRKTKSAQYQGPEYFTYNGEKLTQIRDSLISESEIEYD